MTVEQFSRTHLVGGLGLLRRPLSLNRDCGLLQIQREQATGGTHPVPVILVRRTAAQTDLIMPAIVIKPWPGKTVRATSSENPFQETHWRAPLRGNAPFAFR